MQGAVIFDCDGVLVDSERLSCSAWLPVLARHDVTATLEEIERFIGRTDQAVLAHFRRRTGRDLPHSIIAEREAAYFELAGERLQTFPGLRQVLETLTDAEVPLAVASSGGPRKIRFSLETVGLAPYFPIICSATEVEYGKPAPDLFLLAAERLGQPPAACTVIEDAVPGIEGAAAAGARALGFTSSHPSGALRDAGAAATFDHYRQLSALLQISAAPISSEEPSS